MESGTLKLIELLLVFGGVIAFGVWQLRSVDRDRDRRLQREEQAEAEVKRSADASSITDAGARAAQPLESSSDRKS